MIRDHPFLSLAAAATVLVILAFVLEVLSEVIQRRVYREEEKLLHTTPDGALSSAFAVHIVGPACVSSIVRQHVLCVLASLRFCHAPMFNAKAPRRRDAKRQDPSTDSRLALGWSGVRPNAAGVMMGCFLSPGADALGPAAWPGWPGAEREFSRRTSNQAAQRRRVMPLSCLGGRLSVAAPRWRSA